tara:strand:- start:1436 stop:1774 length:339 start_codon:yes stop_codon:yes gene_type:complete
MANLLKNITKTGSQTAQDNALSIYTVGVGKTTIVIGFNICNITTTDITVTVEIDAAGAEDDIKLVKDLPIPTGASIEIMSGNKMILNAGDELKITSDTTNSVDVLLSIVEQS